MKKQEKFYTIGVRFARGPDKIYTYKVRKGAKVHLGQELVADTPFGTTLVFVVRIDKTPQKPEEDRFIVLKYIEKKVVAL
jgi:hypothetical protein